MIENKYFECYIFLGDFFPPESMKKGSGGRITSLRLEQRGDGKEGGRGRGWLGDATGNAAARAAAGSGGLAAGARRAGGRRRRREAVRGGRCRRLRSSLRQEQLRAAAGSSGHGGGGGGGGSSLQIPGSGSSAAPHTPGTWEPSNRFGPSGPPPPSTAAARPPSRPSPLLGACSGSVRAVAPVRSPVSGCGTGSSSLASFLPAFLCHSARTAAAAAATQARIRPGQGLLCVRSAVCAAA